ncbi:ABC transporter permease [Aureimonas jatrophae]|uniref:Iron(III) transport system permease protein n=1 Tax=Aureimonas jatrophae TaxID=1166073 RepID=A0A1H0F8J7_9HYPH|nr:iron ABC transporter permease [Aureimonas jatrophae]MBB3950130.1 iron(III) transport system permease protein [Aureimonas jatrophae]SDN90915.1 iron(III) transport system permease protein [Aureimonas jatrophae]
MTPSRPFAVRLSGPTGWRLASFLVAGLLCLPVCALALVATGGGGDLWPHLVSAVLPGVAFKTLALLAGVGVTVGVLGTGTAWLVTAYDFPGRRVLEWALLLPLAVPTYVVAYSYLDILHPVGDVQRIVRGLLGYGSPREFRLPDIRSLPGAVLLLGLVLYPYVYLTTRALFLTQAASLVEASRTLGLSRGQVFGRVAVPLARPAIAVGMSLALMETLNDIGASQFLGVQTLTVSVYSTWVNRNDLAGAAQLSLAMLAVVMLLVWAERHARRRQRFAAAAQKPRAMQPVRLVGASAAGAALACALPVLLGFAAPAAYLLSEAVKRVRFAGVSPRILAEVGNTVAVSLAATLAIVGCGLLFGYVGRSYPGRRSALAARLASLGYAVPGTILAIGLLVPVGAFDRLAARMVEQATGVSPGLVLLGSGAALVLAYTVRFAAIAVGGIEAGLGRVSPSLDGAARVLGHGSAAAFRRIHLPLTRTAIASAGLLVFVDCMKELPATLLLRPLNFETLATHLYGEAARGTYEEAAVAALVIVGVGMLPVAVLARLGSARAAPKPTVP